MSVSAEQQTALTEWMSAAEALRDFVESDLEDGQQLRHLIKEVLRAENRVRAVNGYPPRMFSSPDGP